MAQRVKYRIEIERRKKQRPLYFVFSVRKIISIFCIISLVAISNLPLLKAYESHLIIVTAYICKESEIKNTEDWANHPEIFEGLLPLNLGNESLDSYADVLYFLGLKDSSEVRNRLAEKLLILKFNIGYYKTGDFIPEGMEKNINEIAQNADNLLSNSASSHEDLESMAELLSDINNLSEAKKCPDGGVLPEHVITDMPLINKVKLPVGSAKNNSGNSSSEWIELYNPSLDEINFKDWNICDGSECDALSAIDLMIPGKGFAIIHENDFDSENTDTPDNAIKILLADKIGDGLDKDADMLALKNNFGEVVDEMNWGISDKEWTNYNSDIWNPGLTPDPNKPLFARNPTGRDTDSPSDWILLGLPSVQVLIPNGGEIWMVGRSYDINWSASNPNGPDSDLKINIWFSNDSGETWAIIAREIDNYGTFNWRVPLFIDNYFTVSIQARVKIVAIGPENFMAQNWDMSDEDFCPPIDYERLTNKEIEQAKVIGLMSENAEADTIQNAPENETSSLSAETEDLEKQSDSDDSNAEPDMNSGSNISDELLQVNESEINETDIPIQNSDFKSEERNNNSNENSSQTNNETKTPNPEELDIYKKSNIKTSPEGEGQFVEKKDSPVGIQSPEVISDNKTGDQNIATTDKNNGVITNNTDSNINTELNINQDEESNSEVNDNLDINEEFPAGDKNSDIPEPSKDTPSEPVTKKVSTAIKNEHVDDIGVIITTTE